MANTDWTDPKAVRQYEDGFSVRRMTSDDAHIVIGWYSDICATASDLSVVLHAYGDETKAFVGELNGQVIASVVRTPSTDEISYESLLYVKEEFRMFGYGKRMKEAAEKSMIGGVLCIDAHEELLRMNHARGFTTGFELTHYTGPVTSSCAKLRSQATVKLFTNELFEELMSYDDSCYVRPSSKYRRKLLERWTSLPGGQTVVAMHSVEGNDAIIGFGCRRPAARDKDNHVIGPLYANTYDVAWDLVSTLTKDIVGQKIWMTIW